MSISENQRQFHKVASAVSTAEAFYLVFRSLSKKDRLAVAQYIIEDEEIQHSGKLIAYPNKITLESFTEDKSTMPVFESIDELRRDLLFI